MTRAEDAAGRPPRLGFATSSASAQGLPPASGFQHLHPEGTGCLFLFILSLLELQDSNFESDQMDETLQTILEEINLMLE